MNANELVTAIAAVLTTALELGEGPFPASSVYLVLGSDIHKWEIVRDALLRGGLVKISGDSISLTPKGVELANKCNEALAKAH